jgi:hypothetical protein
MLRQRLSQWLWILRLGVHPPALSVEIPSEESALPTAAGREVLNPVCERWTNQTKEELEGQAEHVDSS